MNVVAVDPGINGCGVAVFTNGLLAAAVYIRTPEKANNVSIASRAAAMGGAVANRIAREYGALGAELALEWPRVFRESQRKNQARRADPNDLLALAGVQSVVAGCFFASRTTCYAPTDWKPAGMKKTPTEFRVRVRLSAMERAVLDTTDCPPSLMHNVIDAVGIGLHHVGRSLK